MILDERSPERRLASAILRRAALDAVSGDNRAAVARRWLLGDDAGLLLGALGIHPDRAREWLETLQPVAQDCLPNM